MSIFRCLPVALVCLATASNLSAKEPPAEWRSLPLIEQGRVAPNWRHTGYGTFQVVGETLMSINDPRGLGLLYYADEQFGDCEIRVVYRPKNPTSNSGVYVRVADGLPNAKPLDPVKRQPDGSLSEEQSKIMEASSEAEQGPWYAVHHGYEVQISDTSDPSHRTGAIYSLTTAKEFQSMPSGWNTMVITLDGPKISVRINGVQVSTFDSSTSEVPKRTIWHEPKREPVRPLKGYIGLQNHDPHDIVYFREVSVRPLPQHESN